MSDALAETFDDLLDRITDAEAGRRSLADVQACLASLRPMLERCGESERAELALGELWHAENELQLVRFSLVRHHIQKARRAVGSHP